MSDGVVFRSAQGRWVLLATILGSGMAQLDGTIVNVALPRIGEDLGAGLTSLQWTVNAYSLTLSGLLLLGGSLGDRLGRKRIFIFGVIWFATASAGCAASPTADVLIAMRALQGVGAALLTPGSLAILEAVFRQDDRAEAVGAWSGLGGIASAIGPVLGGLLVGAAPWGWRIAFLINVPMAFAVVLVASRHVPETRDEEASSHLDLLGVVSAAAGLGLVIYGLTEGPQRQWPAATVASLVAGLALLVVFVVNEARTPLAADAAVAVPVAAVQRREHRHARPVRRAVRSLFLLPVQLQRGSGFTPVAAGSALLPVTLVMVLLSARAGRLAQRIGPRLPMTVGPIMPACGLALLTRVGTNASYVTTVLPAVLVFALGLSATVAPLTATVLAAAPVRQVGVASAVNNDVARTAGLLAVAVLPAWPASRSRPTTMPSQLSPASTTRC